MGSPQAFERFRVGGVGGEVVQFVWIGVAVVELLNFFSRAKESFGIGGEFAGLMQAPELLHGGSFFWGVHILIP